MLGNRLIAIALLSLVAATACDDSTGTGNDATLRLANATNSNVDIASGTSVAAGNSNIGFGASSGCVTTNVFEPDLTVSPSGTTNSYASFTPTLRRGESYVAVAYPGFGGAPEFSYIPTSAAVASGQSGLRVFNAVAGSGAYDVYVTAPAAPLGTVAAVGIGFRTASGYLSVPATTNLIRLTNTGTQTVAITSTQIFTAGQNSVLVIAPPTAGSTVPRTFLVNGC